MNAHSWVRLLVDYFILICGYSLLSFTLGLCCRKLPIYLFLSDIPLRFPVFCLSPEGLQIPDSAVQALSRECTEFDLGNIEPAAVFWCRMDFQAFPECRCLLRGKAS